MVSERRSFQGSVRAPPLPIIRDHHHHHQNQHHHSHYASVATGLSPKCTSPVQFNGATYKTPTAAATEAVRINGVNSPAAVVTNGNGHLHTNGNYINRAPSNATYTSPISRLTSHGALGSSPRLRSTTTSTTATGSSNADTFQRTSTRKPLTISEYENSYRLHSSELQLVERVFYGGMDSNQLRAALWPYIFGLVSERGRFIRRPSFNGNSHTATATNNGYESPMSRSYTNGVTTNGSAANVQQFTRQAHQQQQKQSFKPRTSSPASAKDSQQFVYIDHELNLKRWRELERLYATYESQWKSIMPDQELRFSVFRERKSLIERDVIRSDRTHPFYAHDCESSSSSSESTTTTTTTNNTSNSNANLANLTSLLMTYMMYDFDIGYLQGMSDLAAPILYVYGGDLVKSFWVFVEVMKLFRRNFEHSQKTIHFQLNCLYRLIKLTDPKLASYLRQNDCSNCFFVFRCIVCQFKRELMKSSSGGGGGGESLSTPTTMTTTTTTSESDDDEHSDLTSTEETDDEDEKERPEPARDSYAKVLNLWDTIWSVQRRHELLAKSKCTHTFTIANGGSGRSSQRSSQGHKHKHNHHHHHHHHHNHYHRSNHNNNNNPNNDRVPSPMNISSTTGGEDERLPQTLQHKPYQKNSINNNNNDTNSPVNYQATSNNNSQHITAATSNNNHHQKPQTTHNYNMNCNSSQGSPHSTQGNINSTATRLYSQPNRSSSSLISNGGRQSPVPTSTYINGHSHQVNGYSNNHHNQQQQQQQFLKRHSVSSMRSSTGSLGSCCSLASSSPATGAANGLVKQEQVVYTKETFYSSFDPNQTDVPRFELTETEKFVLALCVSLIRRERNAIMSRQMDASEIHQHFINPRLADNFDAFTKQAHETYEYLNTDCDLQLLVKGANELGGGAASDLSPICNGGIGTIATIAAGELPTSSSGGGGKMADSADTTDTFDLLKDYLIISPTSYNVSLSSLNNLHNSSSNICNSGSIGSTSAIAAVAAAANATTTSIAATNGHLMNGIRHLLRPAGGAAGGGGLKKRTASYAGPPGLGNTYSVSQRSWDHALNSETFTMQSQ